MRLKVYAGRHRNDQARTMATMRYSIRPMLCCPAASLLCPQPLFQHAFQAGLVQQI